MDIARRGEAKSARKLGAEVTDNVAKKIASHNHIELAGGADDLHGQGVNEEVPRINLLILLPNLLEDALPELVRKGHGVGVVAHAHTLEIVTAGVRSSGTKDSPDTLSPG